MLYQIVLLMTVVGSQSKAELIFLIIACCLNPDH